MKPRFRRAYWNADIPFSFGAPAARPWPDQIAVRFRRFMDAPSTASSAILLDEGGVEMQELERTTIECGIKATYGRFGVVDEESIGSFSHYQFGAKSNSAGFDLTSIFQRQRPCGLQEGRLNSSDALGCGFEKKQIQKIVVDKPGAVISTDLFSFGGLIAMPHGIFGVSRRFRDAIVGISATGFRFTPIVETSHRWTAEELALQSSADKEQESVARWFQLSIDFRSPALRVEDTLSRERICSICGVRDGYDPIDPAWRTYSRGELLDVDAQVMDRRINADGQEFTIAGAPLIVVTSKVIQAICSERLRGFASSARRWGKFRPLLFSSDSESSGDSMN